MKPVKGGQGPVWTVAPLIIIIIWAARVHVGKVRPAKISVLFAAIFRYYTNNQMSIALLITISLDNIEKVLTECSSTLIIIPLLSQRRYKYFVFIRAQYKVATPGLNNAVCGNVDPSVHPDNDSIGHHDEAQTDFFIISFKSRFAFTLK
jgi:hypothetical protein